MALQNQGSAVSISGSTASSQSSGSNDAGKSHDGNSSSFWDSGTGHTIDTYLRFDMGSSVRVGGCRWYTQFGGGFTPTAWKVQWSDNDSDWTTVATGNESLKNIFTDYGNDSYYIAWNHINHRYWRLQPDTGYSIGNNEWVITEITWVEGAALAAATLSSPTIPAGGTTLTATLSQAGITPASGSGTGGFTLAGTTRTVVSWAISGTTLTLTLSGAVGQGKTVTYSYDESADLTNGDAEVAAFSGVSVTNNSTVAAATLSSPTVPSGGTTLTATLSQSGITPASGSGTGGFTLAGTNRTVASWAISGTTLTLTLSGAVGQGHSITYSYDGSAALTNGEDATATFSTVAVTNNSTVAAPTIGTFTVPAAGLTMTATLSQSGITPGSGATAGGFTIQGEDVPTLVTGWSISGTTLTLTLSQKIFVGDTGITVDYDETAALTNGEDIIAAFSGTTVTNNSSETSSSVANRSFFGLI